MPKPTTPPDEVLRTHAPAKWTIRAAVPRDYYTVSLERHGSDWYAVQALTRSAEIDVHIDRFLNTDSPIEPVSPNVDPFQVGGWSMLFRDTLTQFLRANGRL